MLHRLRLQRSSSETVTANSLECFSVQLTWWAGARSSTSGTTVTVKTDRAAVMIVTVNRRDQPETKLHFFKTKKNNGIQY